MNLNPLLKPIFWQVLLTFILLTRMAYIRISAIRARQVKIKDIALGQNAWSEEGLKAQNSFNNQFQMPVLFYVVILFAMQNQIEAPSFLALAYVFVIARYLHAFIHTSSNNIRFRFIYYAISTLALLAMWILLFLKY